ncbi:HAMP domain-containing sensor histidine kinase [soil metagenome]
MTTTIADDIAAIGRLDVIPKILEVACRTTGMGFAAVARVTEDRWVACAVRDEIEFGLGVGGELVLETTLCNEIRGHGQSIVFGDVSQNETYRHHHTPRTYGLQSYISVPIQHGGAFFGTLCAIDSKPADIDDGKTQATFELFADLIGAHLDNQDRLARSEAALLDAHDAAELREQFIAVLGHDLRNPLASIDGGARLLLKTPLDDRARILVGLVQNSVQRMAGLIDNVLDFARGRLGGGFAIERRPDADLPEALDHVIAELRTAQPDRRIVSDIVLTQPVSADSRRVAQLFSNLLSNALTHGSDLEPVSVWARTTNGQFELSIANAGEAIPANTLARLFHPFTRASARPMQEGLGLGLYIATEIAKAHDGVLSVHSDATETRFTFKMPLV